MEIGRRRHQGILQRQQRTSDRGGGYTEAWTEYGKVWAEIKAPSGRIAIIAQQFDGQVTAEINIRYRSDVKAGDRFVQGDTTYLIEAPLPDNRRTELNLMCSTIENP